MTAGQLPREEILLRDHAEPVERVRHDSLALGLPHVPVRQRNVQILGDREVVDQMILLEDESDVLLVERNALLGVHAMHRLAEEPELTVPVMIEHAEDGE